MGSSVIFLPLCVISMAGAYSTLAFSSHCWASPVTVLGGEPYSWSSTLAPLVGAPAAFWRCLASSSAVLACDSMLAAMRSSNTKPLASASDLSFIGIWSLARNAAKSAYLVTVLPCGPDLSATSFNPDAKSVMFWTIRPSLVAVSPFTPPHVARRWLLMASCCALRASGPRALTLAMVCMPEPIAPPNAPITPAAIYSLNLAPKLFQTVSVHVSLSSSMA